MLVDSWAAVALVVTCCLTVGTLQRVHRCCVAQHWAACNTTIMAMSQADGTITFDILNFAPKVILCLTGLKCAGLVRPCCSALLIEIALWACPQSASLCLLNAAQEGHCVQNGYRPSVPMCQHILSVRCPCCAASGCAELLTTSNLS